MKKYYLKEGFEPGDVGRSVEIYESADGGLGVSWGGYGAASVENAEELVKALWGAVTVIKLMARDNDSPEELLAWAKENGYFWEGLESE